jgi:hypothetical protein
MSEKTLSIMVLLLDKDDEKENHIRRNLFPYFAESLDFTFLFQNIFLGTIGENPAILYGLF